MSTGKIKVKAMAIYFAHGRMLVTPGYDSVKKQPYFRLPGGHVEFGELAGETLRREMQEELAADIEVLERLDVVENVFTYEGRDCHEIVFIHHARFLDDAITRRDDLRNLEADHDETFRWLPVGDVLGGDIRFIPSPTTGGSWPALRRRMPERENGNRVHCQKEGIFTAPSCSS